tara:strand:+ start:1325 stop:1957 length:633 start_codon:yes stop_codon:yes gene_type:complete
MNIKDTDNKIPIYKLTSKKKVLEYYTNWSEDNKYDQDMIDWNYIAPINSAKIFGKYSNDRSIKILDAGCGTGLVAQALRRHGFKNIIGIDFSQDMLDLIPQNIYQKLDLADLNDNLKYQDNEFDGIICVGTFTYGHVKAPTLDEFLRIVKKDGLICFTINEGIYEKYEFDKKIKELENRNKWKVLELKKSNYIVNKDVEAWFCIAKKIIN